MQHVQSAATVGQADRSPMRVKATVPASPSHTPYPLAYELELHRLTEIEAYLHAEKCGFTGSALDHWLAAEKEVFSCF